MPIFTPVVGTHVNTPEIPNDRDAMLKALLQGAQQGATGAETAMAQKGAMDREKLHAQTQKEIEAQKLKMLLGKQDQTAVSKMGDVYNKDRSHLEDNAEGVAKVIAAISRNGALSIGEAKMGMMQALGIKGMRPTQKEFDTLLNPTAQRLFAKGGAFFGNDDSAAFPDSQKADLVDAMTSRIGDLRKAHRRSVQNAISQYQRSPGANPIAAEEYQNSMGKEYLAHLDELEKQAQGIKGSLPKASAGGLGETLLSGLKTVAGTLGGKPSVAQTPQAPMDPLTAEFQKRFGGK